MKLMQNSEELPPYPDGWYCLEVADALKNGDIQTIKAFGQDLVVFRNSSGVVAVVDPHCPHLGAHLGHGSKIVGDSIQCPFHGFCFDTKGACTKTGYGTPPPKKAVLRTWPVQETNGLIMVYYSDSGQAPNWNVPEFLNSEWTGLQSKSWELTAHVQDLAENSVDLGHFSWIHGYEDVKVFEAATCKGPLLSAHYGMTRGAGLIGNSGTIESNFTLQQWGLGFAAVNVTVPRYDLKLLNYVLATPVDEKITRLRIALAIRNDVDPVKFNIALKFIPRRWSVSLLRAAIFHGYKTDVQQDFQIWKNKRYIADPAVVKGDGPINLYRKYAKQFYPALDVDKNAGLYSIPVTNKPAVEFS